MKSSHSQIIVPYPMKTSEETGATVWSCLWKSFPGDLIESFIVDYM